MSVGTAFALVLSNVPLILLALALLIAALGRGRDGPVRRFLAWVLLLPLGVTFLWAALYHLAFPAQAAAFIGWQPSPFQFEVGIADLALGVTSCIAFRASLPFQAAAVIAASVALLGDAAGHVLQMLAAGNFAPGNAGAIFWLDIIVPVLALALLATAWRGRAESVIGRPAAARAMR